MTHEEFYAFMGLFEIHLIASMERFQKMAMTAVDKDNLMDANAKAAVTIALDEVRLAMARAFVDVFENNAGSSNGRTSDFESDNTGSTPVPATTDKKVH